MATDASKRPYICTSALPDTSQAEVDFYDTSFFQHTPSDLSPELPTPDSVMELLGGQEVGVAKYPHLNLAVKFGPCSYLRLEEAQTMRAIRHAFPGGEVPVPEVFGWRKHNDLNFIYMSLFRGQTLREAWPSLTDKDKHTIAGELSGIVASLQRLTHDFPNNWIASINGGSILDRFFKLDYEKGPFLDVQTFNDWIFIAATRQIPGPKEVVVGPYRDLLPNDGKIYFTHGDLTLGNIIVTGETGSKRIQGIIDWEQAGWYPEYWEYCKLLYGVEYSHEWRDAGWVDTVMRSFEDEWIAFSEYSLWRCP